MRNKTAGDGLISSTASSGSPSNAALPRKFQLSRSTLWMSLAGAVGGYLGYNLVSILNPFGPWPLYYDNAFEAFRNQSFYQMCVGLMIGAAILISDNYFSLRGRWNRDLLPGLLVFGGLSLVAGGLGYLGQAIVGITPVLDSIVLCGLAGTGVGASVGLLRKDKVQARQGAIGGLIGGAVAGFFLNAAYANNPSLESVAAASRNGSIMTGALIGLFMRVVQDVLKKSWLVGVSSGPYEGKEYPLNNERVTVGRSELDDISLYRKSELAMPSGALVWESGNWLWQGEAVEVNGVSQTHAILRPGDELKFAATVFRFQTRSAMPEPGRSTAPHSSHLQPFPQQPNPTGPGFQQFSPLPGSIWVLSGASGVFPLPPPPSRVQVGRANQNHVVITDPSVSSNHALIEVSANTLTITDLRSTNGIQINGQPIQPDTATSLRINDRISLGSQEFTIQRV